MLFSLDWLIELCPADTDAAGLAAILTARGLTVDAVGRRGTDHVLDVDVPANRPDCLGHRGLAREIGAALNLPLAGPAPGAPRAAGAAAAQEVEVDLAAPDLCPRYTIGIVRDVRLAPSPDWVVRRLEACGLRSLGNVVDASNLVMLELGQPIHLFDLERLEPAGPLRRLLRVRRAERGEKLLTLDGIERALEPGMLVIADRTRALALAGVIGGQETEIGPATRHVLIEAAHFQPAAVRFTARSGGLHTDASYRFERGVDPQAPPAAQALAARLLAELAGGVPAPGQLDVHPAPAPARRLQLRAAEVRRLLGFDPDPAELVAALAALGLSPQSGLDGMLRVSVPSWRRDLEREADLVEEVVRHLGYDRIPAGAIAASGSTPRASAPDSAERVSDRLAQRGFQEAVGYAMIGPGEDDPFVDPETPRPLALINPLAEPLARLRRSILPGLLRCVELNLRRGVGDVRLFEIGRVFERAERNEAPHEPLRLGLAWTGAGEPVHWSRARREVDLHDLIGVAEGLFCAVAPGARPSLERGAQLAAFHPGISVRWRGDDGRVLAWGGATHPGLRDKHDRQVFLLEAELDSLAALGGSREPLRAVPRVPTVVRDLSLVLTRELPYAQLVATLGSVEAPAPVRFEALDRYAGPPLRDDETALTIRVTLEPVDRTLTDDETERYREALIGRLRDRLDLGIRS